MTARASKTAASDREARTKRRSPPFAVLAIAATALAACSGISTEQLETGALAPSQASDSKSEAKQKTAADAKPAASALAALEVKHRAAPNDPVSALAYASALKNANKTNEARDILAATHAAAPAHAEMAGALGLLELDLGQPAKAQKLLQAATAAADADWRYNSGLGVAHAVQGRPADARTEFQKALAKSPGNKTVLNNLAMTYVMDKKLDRAEGLLRQAKTGDSVPEAVAQNLQLAARLRQSAASADRRADTDAAPASAKQSAAN